MDLEGLLKKGACAFALTGALLLPNGCVPIRTIPQDHNHISLPISNKRNGRSIIESHIFLSNKSVTQNEENGNIYIRGDVKCRYIARNYKIWTESVKCNYKYVHNLYETFDGFKCLGWPEDDIFTKIVSRDFDKEDFEFIPSNILVGRREYEGISIEVNSDGSFDGRIYSTVFKRIPESKYFSCVREDVDIVLSEADSSGRKPSGAKFEPVVAGRATRFDLRINEPAVRKYVDENINSKIVPITINMKDSNTRTAVGIQSLVVKRESSVDIDTIFLREFGGYDEKLFEFVRSCIKYNPDEDAKVSGSGQSLSFNGFEGSKYTIETTDPAYHYTNSSFVANKNSPNKAVLLVEVGQKLRIDETKEGKGTIIDDK